MKQKILKMLNYIGCFVLVNGLIITAIFTFRNLHHYLQQKKYQEIQSEQCDVHTQEIKVLQEEISILKEEKAELTKEIEKVYTTIEEEIVNYTEVKNVLLLSDDDVNLLARLVKCEAGNDSFESKVAICVVVINRINSNLFQQNNLRDIIYAEGQFEPIEKGYVETATATDDCYFAVEYALSLTYNEINERYGTDLLYFRAATDIKEWGSNKEYAFTIGKTDFYYSEQR